MKRGLPATLAVVVAALAAVSDVAAQSVRFGLGGGLALPVGDYKNSDDAGWHVFGKVDVGIPLSPLGVRVDGMYAQTSQKSLLGGHTKLAGGTANLVWHIPTAVPALKPYFVGGVGLYNFNPGGGSETKVAWGGGLGAALALGPIQGFAEARYITLQLSGRSLKLVPVTVGVSFGS
jgi:hypothetical protein